MLDHLCKPSVHSADFFEMLMKKTKMMVVALMVVMNKMRELMI